jgi:hypothetical protein
MRRRLVVVLGAFLLFPPGVTAAKTLPGIRSPSGNITCLYVPGRPDTLRCNIAKADYTSALQDRCMAGPSVDWHGFELTPSRKGMVTCSGGILFTGKPNYVMLPYGKTWRRGVFTCASALTGMTCRSGAGHGLFLSRQSWRGW